MSSAGGKRGSTESPSSAAAGGSVKKRAKIEFDFDYKFIASSQDDLDIGVSLIFYRMAHRFIV